MDLKQEERELQYSPSKWSHRFGPDEVIQEHLTALKDGSDQARKSIECEVDVSYGLSDKEKLDIYGANTLPGEAPIFVYIHGGYWQLLGKEFSGFCVPPLCKAGAVVVLIGYDLAPKVGIDEIVSQVKRAVIYVLKLATRRGSSGVFLAGHSAGGHLAAMMLAQDWMRECMINSSLIKGAALISGVFDVRPIVDISVNDAVKMSMQDAIQNSPALMYDHIVKLSVRRKILVVVGEYDSPEFKRQSEEMNKALSERKVESSLLVIPNTDHFNVVEQLNEEDYFVTKEIIQLMGLNLSSILQQMKTSNIS